MPEIVRAAGHAREIGQGADRAGQERAIGRALLPLDQRRPRVRIYRHRAHADVVGLGQDAALGGRVRALEPARARRADRLDRFRRHLATGAATLPVKRERDRVRSVAGLELHRFRATGTTTAARERPAGVDPGGHDRITLTAAGARRRGGGTRSAPAR